MWEKKCLQKDRVFQIFSEYYCLTKFCWYHFEEFVWDARSMDARVFNGILVRHRLCDILIIFVFYKCKQWKVLVRFFFFSSFLVFFSFFSISSFFFFLFSPFFLKQYIKILCISTEEEGGSGLLSCRDKCIYPDWYLGRYLVDGWFKIGIWSKPLIII